MDTQEKITVKRANSNGERTVYLTIPDAKYKPIRNIGYIKNRTFFTYRNKDNQTFNKTGAIGINYKLLKQGAELFDNIEIKYGVDILQTTREYFLNSGYFLHFKNNGLERQIFLKIKDFGLDKVNKSENDKVIQLNNELVRFADVLKSTSLSMQEGLFQ